MLYSPLYTPNASRGKSFDFLFLDSGMLLGSPVGSRTSAGAGELVKTHFLVEIDHNK
jgi:hypothetical protein